MSTRTGLEPRVDGYWGWVAVALFLLLAVDFFTSAYAASAVGLEHEINPLVSWLLAQPIAVVIGAYAVVGALVVALFAVLFELVRGLPAGYRGSVALWIEAFLGLLVAVGLFALANNLLVIGFGRSLI